MNDSQSMRNSTVSKTPLKCTQWTQRCKECSCTIEWQAFCTCCLSYLQFEVNVPNVIYPNFSVVMLAEVVRIKIAQVGQTSDYKITLHANVQIRSLLMQGIAWAWWHLKHMDGFPHVHYKRNFCWGTLLSGGKRTMVGFFLYNTCHLPKASQL